MALVFQLRTNLPVLDELQNAGSAHFSSFVLQQDACYTGITRDAGADSFIPTVCFAD